MKSTCSHKNKNKITLNIDILIESKILWNYYFSYCIFHVILTDKDLVYIHFWLVVVDIQNVDLNFYEWLQTYKEEKITHFDQHIWLPQRC